MSCELVFAPAVAVEITEAAAWYESQREGLGRELLDAIEQALERIRRQPGAGAPWHEYRKGLVRRFPYLIVYRATSEDEVEVVAVAHMSRRPGYWIDR